MPDRRGRYSYFDTPDGQDGPKKAWYISKYLAQLGFATGTLDALNITRAQTKLGVLLVYAKHIGLAVGAGLAFTCTTFISTDLRKKDDEVNHALGAVAASSVFGAAAANPWVFGTLVAVSVPIAYVNKTAVMDGVGHWHSYKLPFKKEYPLKWHTFELDMRSDSLKKRYEKENEEYFRNRSQQDSQV